MALTARHALALETTPLVADVPEQKPPVISVELLAMEYPPYTAEYLPDKGSVIALLDRLLQDSHVRVVPKFVPPARALYLMERGEWMASTIPAPEVANQELIILQDAKILFGLFRLRADTPFVWQDLSELKGHKVAVTRAVKIRSYNSLLMRSGLELVFVENISQAMQLLKLGRVHYVLTVEDTGWYILDALGMKKSNFQFSQTYLDEFSFQIHVNLETVEGQALKDALRKAGAR